MAQLRSCARHVGTGDTMYFFTISNRLDNDEALFNGWRDKSSSQSMATIKICSNKCIRKLLRYLFNCLEKKLSVTRSGMKLF